MDVEAKLTELAGRLDMDVELLRADFQKHLSEGKNEVNAIVQLRRQYKRMLERKNGWLVVYPFSRTDIREVTVTRKNPIDGLDHEVTDQVADLTGAFLFKDEPEKVVVTTLSCWGEAAEEVLKVEDLTKPHIFKGSYDDFTTKIYMGKGQHISTADDKLIKTLPSFGTVIQSMMASLVPISNIGKHVNQVIAVRAVVANVVKNKSKASGKEFKLLEIADEDSDIVNCFVPNEMDVDGLAEMEVVIVGKPQESEGKITMRAVTIFAVPA